MKGFQSSISGIARFLNMIGGISLTFLMAVTVGDVVLRFFRRPIVGTYELVAFSGAVVIGFSIPLTSWMRGHVCVDFLILKFSQKTRNMFNMITRCLVISLFLVLGWNLIQYGVDLQVSGEVSPTLHFPFFPVAYGIGICCFFQSLVLVCDILKIREGKYE